MTLFSEEDSLAWGLSPRMLLVIGRFAVGSTPKILGAKFNGLLPRLLLPRRWLYCSC